MEKSKSWINPPHRPIPHLVYRLPRPYNAAVYLDRLQDHILSSRKLSYLLLVSSENTILQTAFACSAAPLHSVPNLLRGWFWIWTHQLMCNVSNQCRSRDEDIIIRPWRPVPSGRISVGGAVVLRWTLVFFCIFWSALNHDALVLSTFSLVTTTFLYDELELASHPIGKNLCNIGGYTSFEAGATMIMGIFDVPTEMTDSNSSFRAILFFGWYLSCGSDTKWDSDIYDNPGARFFRCRGRCRHWPNYIAYICPGVFEGIYAARRRILVDSVMLDLERSLSSFDSIHIAWIHRRLSILSLP